MYLELESIVLDVDNFKLFFFLNNLQELEILLYCLEKITDN